MATRNHTKPRHVDRPQQTGRIPTAIAHAVGWVIADHDDRIPNLIQQVLWFAALLLLFTCLGVQR